VRPKASGLSLPHWPIFSTPETYVHVQDKNREISPLYNVFNVIFPVNIIILCCK